MDKKLEHSEQTLSKHMNPFIFQLRQASVLFVACFLFGQKVHADSFNDGFHPNWLNPWAVSAGPDVSICFGESTQLQATGANSYTWAPATGLSCTDCPNPVASPNVTTTYFVTGDDGTVDEVVVKVLSPPVILDVDINQPTDCNLSNGSIAIITLGLNPYEYSIDGGNIWQNNGVFTALPPGNYHVLVRGSNGICVVDGGSFNLIAPPPPHILDVIAISPTFCDFVNGSIVISANSGIGPLQYSIDNGQTWQTQNTFQLLGSGNYQVKVRNATGSCETSGGTVTLTGSPDEAIIDDIFVAHPTNCDEMDGLITVIVPNNGGQFEFSINGGQDYQPSNNFTGLDEGVYHVLVRRTDGTCSKSGGFVTLVSPNRPTIYGISAVNPQGCGVQNGNITILAFGPSTLQFSIDGGVTWHGSNIFQNLPVSTYNIAVQNDDGSCFTNGGTITLTEPGPPVIEEVNLVNPSACGVSDGSINITATGFGLLEYSINNGGAWQSSSVFNNLPENSYDIKVRYVGGGCPVDFVDNPVVLDAPGDAPVIGSVNIVQPSSCGVPDGSITISASGSGPLSYSINGGASFQGFNIFTNLAAGNYAVVVKLNNSNCSTTSSAQLFYSGCTDTVQLTIGANINTDYCIDQSVFNGLGVITAADFCDAGNAQTVLATGIQLNCLTLSPTPGFTGISPNLICTIHCFNNTNVCDTTYLQVTVQDMLNCDDVFSMDTVTLPYIGNPTNYCVPIPLTDLLGYDLYLNGTPFVNPFACDFEPTTAYSFTFLPGAGFSGPYSLDSWTVNGVNYTGFFNDAIGLLALMQAFDPAGNWQINLITGLIYGGDSNANYGDIEVTHVPSGSQTILNTNTTFLPTGFTVGVSDPGVSELIVQNPTTTCADTLYINAVLTPTTTDTVFLVTNVNQPTVSACLDGSELPGGVIANVGYCGGPMNGSAPLTSPTCVFYIPNLNFAGQDQFCMVACDGGFPQICDTTYFIVNVIPENDTVYLTIPAGETSVDTCLDNFVIELPGGITSADFCGINSSEISGSVNSNCLVLNSNGTFYGTTTVCVSFCSGNFCDENTFIVTIVPSVICDDIFPQNAYTFDTPNPDNQFCMPIPTADIVTYDVTLDGAAYNQSFTPCDFQILAVYSYASLPANGPYTVNAWTANGTLHSGTASNIADLVNLMNVWDPSGNWVEKVATQTIQGGQGGTYSDMSITPAGGSQQILTLNLVQFPLGSEVTISGYGSHEIIVTAVNGCADTVQVTYVQHIITTDTLVFNTAPNTSIAQICGNTDDLLGNLFSISFCGLPANGGFVPINATCFTYTPNLGFIGSDTACVVFCDDNIPTVCDTFIFVMNVMTQTDTVYVNAPGTSPFDTCLDASIIQLPGNLSSSTICGANQNEVTLTLTGNCVTIDLEDNFVGTTTACVVYCDDSTPQVCDTTYLVITVNDNPNPCPEIFNPNQIFTSLQNGAGEVCLPLTPAQIIDYQITLDGQPYGGPLTPCNIDQVYIYFFGQVFGQGANGPYSVSWQANGQNFSSVVQNMQELVDQMNIWDFAGNWNIEQPTFSIISTNDNGVYGNLIISHIATGIISTIAPNFNGVPFGTAVQINGAGQHELVVESQVDGCTDTLTINALNDVASLDIFTNEDVPSNVQCIDTTGLPGNFQTLSICEAPQNGTITIFGNCFVFTPDPGFVGTNTGCVVVCDDQGVCDTTLLNITVSVLCGSFNIFPDTVMQLQVLDCADISAVCTPILLDSIGNYGILDNGFPYAGNFVVCNGQFAQIALDTGFHELVFVQFSTGCQDTLLANVSCTSNDGCGISALSPLTIDVDDCAATAQFCVSVSVLDLPNFLITNNGAAFGGTVGICDLNGTTVGLTLDTGLHVLILADTVKGCADTFAVNVLCTIIEDVTVDITIPEGNTQVLCLEDYGYLTSTIDSVVAVCTLNGNASYTIDPATWCITFLGESVGLDTACFEVFVGDTSAIFTVNIEVTPACPVFIPGGILATGVPCSVDTGLICLPITFLQLVNKTLTLDGQPYTGQLLPCGIDSIFILNYTSLPSQGVTGPYIIQSWSINGSPFTGVFNTAQELADQMNLWDPTGNWQVVFDPNNNVTVIQGGDPTHVYSDMVVEQQLTGVIVSLGINTVVAPTGVSIEVPLGGYTLTITDTVTLCSETALVELVCVASDTVEETILLGTQDTFCLDLSELVGNPVSATNICPGSNGETVSFTIDSSFCVIYQGNETGIDSACVIVCDDAGLCDTTYFFITVTINNDSLPIAVDDTGNLTSQGDATIIQVLDNDTVQFLLTVTIVDQPAHGEAQVLPNGTINYVPDADYCDEDTPDSFTYAICNPNGCDTATVFVTVLCSTLEIFDAFSPNGDGTNETFKINGLQNWPNHHLTVFNRWGTIVYESTLYLNDWDGTWKDKKLPDGTYFYILELGDGGGTKRGYVVILR